MEVVKDIADQLGESPNGVRMILTRAGVYVKKTPASSSAKSTGGGRVSKADAQEALSGALSDAGMEVDESIINKLTGKAAVYLTGIVEKLNS
jgi:osmotically-inducible protein OsmY